MTRKEKRNVFKRILKRKGIYLPEDRFVGLNGLRLYEYEIIDLSLFSKLRGCYILNQLGEFYIVKMDKHKKLDWPRKMDIQPDYKGLYRSIEFK